MKINFFSKTNHFNIDVPQLQEREEFVPKSASKLLHREYNSDLAQQDYEKRVKLIMKEEEKKAVWEKYGSDKSPYGAFRFTDLLKKAHHELTMDFNKAMYFAGPQALYGGKIGLFNPCDTITKEHEADMRRISELGDAYFHIATICKKQMIII